MTISNIRFLTEEDRSALELFLESDTERCMFMRYNLQRGGLNYSGKPGQSIFLGAFHNEALVSVLSLSWNNHIQLFAPVALQKLCSKLCEYLQRSNRPVVGINGATEFVRPALDYLDLTNEPKQLDNDEKLYSLELNDLRIPDIYHNASLRPVRESDFDTLVEWQIGYAQEALGAEDNEELRNTVCKRIRSLIDHARQDTRILEVGGEPVSRSNFTAVLPKAVMLGGVWTPDVHRNKGYARTAIAAHLVEARENGVEKAVLFTNSRAAAKAYEALGFKSIGLYSMILFSTPWTPS